MVNSVKDSSWSAIFLSFHFFSLKFFFSFQSGKSFVDIERHITKECVRSWTKWVKRDGGLVGRLNRWPCEHFLRNEIPSVSARTDRLDDLGNREFVFASARTPNKAIESNWLFSLWLTWLRFFNSNSNIKRTRYSHHGWTRGSGSSRFEFFFPQLFKTNKRQ